MRTLPFETIYHGTRRRCTDKTLVSVGLGKRLDRLLLPGPSIIVRFHSSFFEWGYLGSGPSQLALAILLDFTRDAEASLTHYMDFKTDYVAGWDAAGFSISGAEIVAWLMQRMPAADRDAAAAL